jgi:VCBS repeat-containing protein
MTTYSGLTGTSSLLAASVDGQTLTLDYLDDQNGQVEVTVTATDQSGEEISDTFVVTVNAVNDDPAVIAPIDDLTVPPGVADDVIDLSTVFDDVDRVTEGDWLAYSVTGNSDPSQVTATVDGEDLLLDFADDGDGSSTITVRATDLAGAFVEDAFVVTVDPNASGDVVVDNAQATVTGDWQLTDYRPNEYGSDYLHDKNTGKGAKSVTFTPNLAVSGQYEVSLWWPVAQVWATNVPVDVNHAGGTDTVSVNQSLDGGEWNSIGTYDFTAGSGSVTIRTDGTTSHVAADAVQFVLVSATGTAPVAVDDAYQTDEGVTLSVDAFGGVLANDSDPQEDPLTAHLGQQDVSNGSLTLNNDGSFTYVPDPGFTGEDLFTYQAYDGNEYSNEATVTITVTGSAPAEAIVDNAAAVVTGEWIATTYRPQYYNADYLHDLNAGKGAKSVEFTPDLGSGGQYEVYLWWPEASLWAANVPVDVVYDGGTETVAVDQSANGGQWNLVGSYQFAPGAGSVVIRTTGTDSHVAADAVRFVQVSGGTAPVAADDAYQTDKDVTLIVDAASGVLANDTDPQEDPLTAHLGQQDVSNGSLTLNTDGSFTYVPNPGFTGQDTFTYQAFDGSEYSAEATVTITVNGDAPAEAIVDNATATVTGDWLSTTYRPNYYDSDYLHDANSGKGSKSVTFSADLGDGGQYAVYLWWPEAPVWATNVPVDVSHDGGTDTVFIDQSTGGGDWYLIGTWNFFSGLGSVTIRNDGTTSHVAADAVRFTSIP